MKNPPKRVILTGSKPALWHLAIYPIYDYLTVRHRLRLSIQDDDKQREDLGVQNLRSRYRLVLDYLVAGLAAAGAAGVAAAGVASTLAGALFAGTFFFSSFLTSGFAAAGALAAGAGAAAAGAAALGASAAKADIANMANTDTIADFILSFLRLM